MITETIRFPLPTISRTCLYEVTANRDGVVCRASLDDSTVEENFTRLVSVSRTLSWSDVTDDSLFRMRVELTAAIEFNDESKIGDVQMSR